MYPIDKVSQELIQLNVLNYLLYRKKMSALIESRNQEMQQEMLERKLVLKDRRQDFETRQANNYIVARGPFFQRTPE